MADLNETETARVAFEEAWRQLAPHIDDARHAQAEVAKRPSLYKEPLIEAQVKWLSIFDQELAAAQTVFETLQSGARLSAEDLYAARKTAERLLQVISNATQQVPEPA